MPLADGSVIIGGEFTQIGNTAQPYLAKYRADGSLDTSFLPTLDGAVEVIESASRGGIYVGGHFSKVNGTTAGKLALVKNSGILDTTFSVGAGFDGPVYTVKENLISGMPILVGGAFSKYRGANATNLAGLSSSGFLAKNYFVNGPVKALAKHPYYNQDEFVFGGTFTLAGGQPVSNIAVATSSFVTRYSSGTNGEITELTFGICSASPPYNQVPVLIIGGTFSTFGGTPAPGIAAIVSGQTEDMPIISFQTSGANNTSALTIDSESRLLACGQNGGLWRFDPLSFQFASSYPTWSASSDFQPAPHANGKIDSIAQESKLRYYIGGDFSSVDGQAVPYFARLYGPQGSAPPAAAVITGSTVTDDRVLIKVNPIPYALSYDVEISGDGGVSWHEGGSAPRTLSAAASFIPATGLRSSATYLARVRARNTNGPGLFGDSFGFSTTPPRRSGPAIHMPLSGDWAIGNSGVKDLLLDASGRLAIVGPNDFGGNLFGGFAVLDDRFQIDFSLNTTNNPLAEYAAAIPSGGYIISTANAQPLRKLDAEGSPVSAFAPAYNPNDRLSDMVVQSDGKIILAGTMRITDGAPNHGIVRLEADGALDAGFDPMILDETYPGAVREVSSLPGNRLLLVGDFTSIDGIPRYGIAILDSTGAVDTSFTPDAVLQSYWIVNSAAPDPQGRIVIAGDLGSLGEHSDNRAGVRRLLADGTVDPTFVPPVLKQESGISSYIYPKIALQPDGKVIVYGSFSTVHDQQARGIARLDTDGSLDTGFDVGLGAGGVYGPIMAANAVLVMPDSSIAVGGVFTLFDGETREGFVLLRGDQTPSDFDLWLKAYNLPALSSPTADDDGDGRTLAAEFACHSNPHIPDFSPIQTSGAGTARLNPVTQRGLKTTGYFSNDLSSWESVPIHPDWTIRPPDGAGNRSGFFRFGLELKKAQE